jgi:hypothetical protein
MLTKLTESELEFMEDFYNPVILSECLFSDLDNLALFNEKNCKIREGQFPLLSFEYLIDYNPKLSDKENFRLKEGAGQCWVLGGRRFGKSLITEIVDILISTLLLENEHIGFTSFDSLHIRGIIEKIIISLENHPILSLLNAKINRSPNYRILIPKTGFLLESVNMNLSGKAVGAGFFQKHFTRLIIEECSFETDEVYNKRIDAVSEMGCVVRAAGMTNFTKYSPCGRIFYDKTKQPWVMNIPQYINPKWDEKQKQKAIKEYGGQNAPQYRIFVGGEVIEDGLAVFDMVRVRQNYDEDKVIKHFEINKESFNSFKYILQVERPTNCTQLYICADIGETAPTEIIIISQIVNGDKKLYKYIYNITLYNLTDKEQYEIFKYLGETLEANFIALDTTEGQGRAIYRALEEVFPKENLIWVGFNEKLPIDIEKNEKGFPVYSNGVPVYREEYVSEWSIKRLKDLLYEVKTSLPLDYKLDMQINSVIATQSGQRTVYSVVSEEDHLLSAFRVFSIAEWQTEGKCSKKINIKRFSKL